MNITYKRNSFDLLSKNNSIEQIAMHNHDHDHGDQVALDFVGDFVRCKGIDRNMFLTVTRVRNASSIARESNLTPQSRVMQAV